MPELPEVETIKRTLVRSIEGARIVSVAAKSTRVFQSSANRLGSCLPGQLIVRIWRRGKFLVLDLESHSLVLHLGMTGQVLVHDVAETGGPGHADRVGPKTGNTSAFENDRHLHFEALLDRGGVLQFRDVRRFGRILLIEKSETAIAGLFGSLGLEPLGPDYTFDHFLDKLGQRRVRIKSFLLDQASVAGVGNIYADEALFAAGIHPARRVRSLRVWERQRLFDAIPAVLLRSLELGGTTLRDYLDSNGQKGNNQARLAVYGRTGEPCLHCGQEIQKTVISQRGTHFCPRCQPRRPSRGARRRQLQPSGAITSP